jgi:hypothetical protein
MTTTECPLCWRTEASWSDKLAKAVLTLARPQPRFSFGPFTAMMAAATGRPAPTWYERHRDTYARTGDPAELARMLRHV